MKKQKKNLLVTLADENYIDQAKQLFSSVYWNAGWKGDYMLLAHKIPEKKLKWFRGKGILIRKCKTIAKKNKYPKSVILCKFYLFTPEFRKWKNIIFLDADMIVRASLDELTKIKGFAAISDTRAIKHQFIKSKLENNKLKEYLGNYDLKRLAFNSGVMAFTTDMIKKDTFSKLKKLYEQHINLIKPRLFDQAILNLFFYKNWEQTPLLYNFNPTIDKSFYLTWIKKPKIKGIILHLYECKPWLPKSPFYKEWKYNLDKAKLISLKKIQPCEKWTNKEIQTYRLYLNFKNIICETLIFIDEYIGLFGIILKKYSPKLYFKLKRLKDRR